MPEIIVIADTSCLISLTRISAVFLLNKLYKEIYITEEIATEFGEALPDWIKIKKLENINYRNLLSNYLDPGEASAIALAFELKEVLLVLDDLKGRREAEKLGFKVTGTLGVLFRAKQEGLIKELKPSIDKLIELGFRISQNVIDDILKRSNE